MAKSRQVAEMDEQMKLFMRNMVTWEEKRQEEAKRQKQGEEAKRQKEEKQEVRRLKE